MAFNPENYLKSNSKTSIDRVIFDAAVNSIAGNPQPARTIASDLGSRLLTDGLSSDGSADLISGQVSAAVTSMSEMYYALAGLDVSRTNGAKLSNLRRSSTRLNEGQLQNIHPATKIAKARRTNRVEILTAI